MGSESGQAYYYNTWTGDTTWEAPAGYYGYDGNYYGTYTQQTAEQAQHEADLKAAEAEAEVKLKGWELTLDVTSSEGAVYYTNLATGITQWEMPAEMDGMDFLENVTELNLSNNRLSALAPVNTY